MHLFLCVLGSNTEVENVSNVPKFGTFCHTTHLWLHIVSVKSDVAHAHKIWLPGPTKQGFVAIFVLTFSVHGEATQQPKRHTHLSVVVLWLRRARRRKKSKLERHTQLLLLLIMFQTCNVATTRRINAVVVAYWTLLLFGSAVASQSVTNQQQQPCMFSVRYHELSSFQVEFGTIVDYDQIAGTNGEMGLCDDCKASFEQLMSLV